MFNIRGKSSLFIDHVKLMLKYIPSYLKTNNLVEQNSSLRKYQTKKIIEENERGKKYNRIWRRI